MKKQIIFLAAFTLISITALAYGPLGPDDPGINAAPIDGGLSFVLVAGIAGYGAKKIADKKRMQKEQRDK